MVLKDFISCGHKNSQPDYSRVQSAARFYYCGKLAFLLNNAGVTQMLKTPGHEVRVMVTKTMAIKAMLIAMVRVMGMPMVRTISSMPMSGRGIQLISFKAINYSYLVIIFIGLIRLSKKTDYKNGSLQSKVCI